MKSRFYFFLQHLVLFKGCLLSIIRVLSYLMWMPICQFSVWLQIVSLNLEQNECYVGGFGVQMVSNLAEMLKL